MTKDETHSLGECLKHWRLQKGLPLEAIAFKTRIPLKYLRALEANDFSTLPPLDTLHHTLGDSLRECREQQGFSLERIAEQTRVPLSYLKALEENDSLHMPDAPVIARAFIDAYLNCLNLHESQKENVLIQFAKLAETVYAKPQQEPADPPSPIFDGTHRAWLPPVATFHGQCQEFVLTGYLKIVDWRASFCRHTASAGHTAAAWGRQFLHRAAAASTAAEQAAYHTMTVYAERIVASARIRRARTAVWQHTLNTLTTVWQHALNALTACGSQIRPSFAWMRRDTVPLSAWYAMHGHALEDAGLAPGLAGSYVDRFPPKMGVKMWVWMVQYGITILLLLLLGSMAANIPLFKETALIETKLDASQLVEFLGYGGALAMAWLMSRKAAVLLDRDRSGFAFLRPLVVPLTALLVASASYRIALVLMSPFFSKADRLAYNWIFVVLILASTLWVILAWFFKSAPMLESLEAASREKHSIGVDPSPTCPHCRTTVPNGMKYCGQCGIAVPSVCD